MVVMEKIIFSMKIVRLNERSNMWKSMHATIFFAKRFDSKLRKIVVKYFNYLT